ncbi:DUF7848 domain-containing protein [Streptomyces sp. 4N509B]|uniref:DUF7848 domain-containing protein n=1 Tax=Streptomyces sp. 4N509B TaxID=3457413 RepID=UPI003FD1D3F7
MSAHVVLRGATLMLCAERAQEAPAALYRAACLSCPAESDLARDDPRPVQVWALGHAEEFGLEHHQFRVTAHDYWRVDPIHAPVGAVPWPPVGGAAPPPGATVPGASPGGSAARARPRRGWRLRRGMRRWRRPVVALAIRGAGFLLVSVLVLWSALGEASPGSARGRHAPRGGRRRRGRRVTPAGLVDLLRLAPPPRWRSPP